MEKHLHYYAQHSQYVEPTDKPAVSYCEQEDEVHYHPDPFNGHEYVDLGLPSGTLWAKCNVGANSETDYGLYFAWGETQGYTDASTKGFRWNNYKFGTSSNLTKYNSTDGKTVLDAEDDAASVNMGGEWHMPTEEQCEELLNTTYMTNAWVENYQNSGVNGRLFTSVSNGNTLFIPAAGFYYDLPTNFMAGEQGTVWTSSLGEDFASACDFGFLDNAAAINEADNRCAGNSVRGVVGNIIEV